MIALTTLHFSLLLIVSLPIKGSKLIIPGNETEELRSPRVSGRIVKVYSGSRPEPFLCNSEGFQADPVSCTTFYRCVSAASGKFTVFRYQCGPGTVYDPEKEICNHPQNTRRSECGGSLSSEHNSQNEVAVQSPTRPQDTSNVIPWWSHNTQKPWPTPAPTTMSTVDPWSKPNFSQETTTKGGSQNNAICTSDGFMGDTEDCRKFYRCVGNSRGGFMKYEYFCSTPTIWDDDIQACNHAWAVRRRSCGRSMSDQFNQFGSKYQQTTPAVFTEAADIFTHSYLTTKKENISRPFDDISPSNTDETICTSSGFVGDKRNCKIFYKCIDNGQGGFIKHQYKCKQGTLWDSDKEACNHEWAVTSCGSDLSKFESTTRRDYLPPAPFKIETTTRLFVGNKQQKTSTTSSPYNTKNQKGSKEDQCTSSGFMGSKNDCKKFYRCVDNGNGGFTRYEFTCGDGTVWDSNIQACNHAWAVKNCGADSDIQKETTTEQHPKPSTETDHDNDCKNNTGTSSQTTTSFSTSTTTETNSIEDSASTKPQTGDGVCKSEGFHGDPHDCKKFYRCVDNGKGGYIRYDFVCGDGTVWDPEINACNHPPPDGGCKAGYNEQPLSDTEFSTSQPQEQNTDHDNEVNGITEVTTAKPTKPNSDCDDETTSKKPELSNGKCTADGFYGDPTSCKKFYRCVDNGNGSFTKYDFTCGDGTVWDAEINACNHPPPDGTCGQNNLQNSDNQSTTKYPDHDNTETVISSSTREPTTTSSNSHESSSKKPSSNSECKSEGFYGDPNDCKKFYRCVDNGQGSYTKYEFSCGDGTVWDAEINTCNHPSDNNTCKTTNTDWSHVESTTHTHHLSDDEMVTEPSSTTSTSSTDSDKDCGNETSSKKPQTTTGECKSEGFHGDINDCKKFYRCVDDGKGGYIKYDFTCGEGTVWDGKIQACNHESEYKNCSVNSMSSTPSQSQTETTESHGTYSTDSGNEHTTQRPQSTPSKDHCSSEGFYADSNDCRKFYRCVDDGKGGYTKYEFSCGTGTVWVQEIQACDHDDGDNTCSKENTYTTSASDHNGTPGSTTTEHSTTSSSKPQKPEEQHDEYPESTSSRPPPGNDQCRSEGFYGNSKDCTQFYRCVDDGKGGYIKYDFKCGEGTAWDADANTCNHISEVKNCQDSSQQSNGDQSQQSNGDQSQQSNDDQSKPGTQDDDQTQTSTTSQSSTSSSTSTESSKKNTCEHEGYYGNTDDCKKFYRCVDNGHGGFTKYDFTCGDGTIWDQDVTTCNHPESVTNPSCKQNSDSSNGSTMGNTDNSSNSSQESSNSEDNKKDVNCTKAGYYPDKNDCKKFYRCVDWNNDGSKFSVFWFECGEGTIWDPELDTCNHEDSVYPPRDCKSESMSASEQTTTQKNEVTEENTTEHNDHTTTQQSTEETTTEESTSSHESTTSESDAEHTTSSTHHSTTEESTTEQSTTEQSTTQQSTTDQSTTESEDHHTTTQQSTTSEEHTTTEQTTSEHTTEHSHTDGTTDEHTTHESTTEDSSDGTTHQSTTEESTTSQTTEHNTTDSESSTTESMETSTESSSDSNDKCPKTEDDQHLFVCPTSFRRHPKYCNLFYQCTEDEETYDVNVTVFKCPNNTIYDEQNIKCVEEKKASKKCDGEIAQRRYKRNSYSSDQPMELPNKSLKCKKPGYKPLGNEECSPGFVKCERSKSGKLGALIYRCPEGYLYWSVSQRCERKSKIRLCKNSNGYNWNRRWQIPIEKRNLAP